MPEGPTLEQQLAEFKAFATTDGAVSDGGDHPDETAAQAQREEANQAAAAGEAASKEKRAQAGTAEAATETATEETETEETAEESETSAETEAAVEAAKAKTRETAQQRKARIQGEIDALTRQKHELVRETEALRSGKGATQQSGLTDGKQAATEVKDGAPKPEDFEYGELDGRYIKALATYEAKQAFKAEQAAAEQRSLEAKAAEFRADMQVKAEKHLEAGLAKYNDFKQVVAERATQGLLPITATMGELILNSDVGPDIAYYIAQHDSEARAIAAKPPIQQAAYIGRLEARFSAQASGATAAKVAKTTQAKPPIATAKGGGGTTGSASTSSSFADFEREAMGQK